MRRWPLDLARRRRDRARPPSWADAALFPDADATSKPGGWPKGGLTVVAFTDHHLVYALASFALAALSAGGAAVVMRRRR